MGKNIRSNRAVAYVLISIMSLPSFTMAATTPLVQFPPGNASRDPSPNVIITVDDSGSMDEAVGGGDTRTKMFRLKEALTDAFSADKIADDRIRLAWQSMWGCSGFPGVKVSPGTYSGCAANSNLMKKFSGTHRTNFTNFITNLKSDQSTPSHRVITQAGEYMKSAASINSPWASDPGVAELPYLECRKSYHIFLTDGEWNGETNNGLVGNADGTSLLSTGAARVFPDGKSYDVTDDQTRVYRDSYGGSLLGKEVLSGQETLSDLAFYYWSTDLQPQTAMPNGPNDTTSTPEVRKGVQPVIRKSGVETVNGVVLQEYWNPRNDPATWQHITQYTIGFGSGATAWTGNPKFDNSIVGGVYTNNNYGTNTGGYADLVAGTVTWPNVIAGTARTAELWHMALNGRGKFFPARSAGSLSSAFNEILDNIKADTSKPLVTIATSSTALRNGATAYVAGYNGDGWSGQVAAKNISSAGVLSTAEVWNSATKLDAISEANITDSGSAARRLILSSNGTASIEFFFDNLSTAQKLIFTGVGGLTGDRSVNYIRGSHADEQSVSGTSPFRNRNKYLTTAPTVPVKTRQGDIVNSNIWYVGQPSGTYTDTTYKTFRNTTRTPVIYVGGNDGMLHGFKAETGDELLAYIPKGIISKLPKLTNTAYGDNSTGSTTTHLYYVDGSPFAGDIKISSWKTYLAGTLGAGGKGYFVLDVTSPGSFLANKNTTLIADNTYADGDNTDPDMGYIFGDPSRDLSNTTQASQFTQLNVSNNWALISGNGYNSTNGLAKLIVHNFNTNSVTKIGTNTVANNGLSTPRLIDINGDGKTDLVYAGDLKGNLWKFDFTSGVPSSGTIVFTDPNNRPITTAPVWIPHPLGGIMLGFGTGQNLTEFDRSDKTTQYTLYGVWDKAPITISSTGVITIGSSSLATISNLVQKDFVSSTATNPIPSGFRLINSSPTIDYEAPSSKRGWFLNLEAGERALFNPSAFVGNFVIMPTTVPSSGSTIVGETCTTSTAAGYGYINIVNLLNGNPRTSAAFDTDGNGIVNASDASVSSAKVDGEVTSLDLGGLTGDAKLIDAYGNTETTSKGKSTAIYSNWRQLQ